MNVDYEISSQFVNVKEYLISLNEQLVEGNLKSIINKFIKSD